MTKCNKIDMIDYDVFNNENKLKDHTQIRYDYIFCYTEVLVISDEEKTYKHIYTRTRKFQPFTLEV